MRDSLTRYASDQLKGATNLGQQEVDGDCLSHKWVLSQL